MKLFKSFNCISLILQIASVNSISFEEDTTLNLRQKELLDKFRVMMKGKLSDPYMNKDIYLIKWLRSSDFDLKVAEKRLLNNLEWRIKQRLDTIKSEDWYADMQKDFKYFLQGRDKYGRSFLYFDVGTLDVRRAIIQGKAELFSRYTDKALDEGIPVLLGIVISSNQHFPECADQIITVNTPSIVEPMLNAIRPLLSNELKNSLRFYGTNKKEWMEKMSKDFDFSKLPPAIGGTQIYDGMEDF